MKKRGFKLNSILIGGLVGAVVGVLFSIEKAFGYYYFNFNTFIFLISFVIGIILGLIYLKFDIKYLFLFSGTFYSALISLYSIDNYSRDIISMTLGKIILFPFGYILKSPSFMIGLILIIVEWSIIGFIVGYLVKSRLK